MRKTVPSGTSGYGRPALFGKPTSVRPLEEGSETKKRRLKTATTEIDALPIFNPRTLSLARFGCSTPLSSSHHEKIGISKQLLGV
ncbi:hypothetical protein AUG19_02105 [archaeon 13_1_20CM_2_54_9]|nr:MAG: hypothetical protein AUG19_02105 [archaeon 13_1_20CM_2_54_9]